jgi:uncharacterized membrane protein YbhN (UPF0104 family)
MAASAFPGLAKNIAKTLVGLVIGVGIATFAIHATGVSWTGIRANFAIADPVRIAIAFLIGGYGLSAAQAVRWRAVLRGIHPVRLWIVFQSKLVGFASNSILPARLGDLVRIEFVSAVTNIPRSKVLATGVMDLWFDKIGWIVTFGIAYFVAPMPKWVLEAMLVMGAILIVVGAALYFLSRGKTGDTVLGRFRQGLDQPNFGRLCVQQLWLSPLSWIWETLLILFVASAFRIPINFAQAFAVLTAFNVSMVVPIPANVGMFEMAATYALRGFGVDPARALSFSLVYHLVLLIPGVLTGAIFFSAHGGKFGLARALKQMREPKGALS